MSYIPNIFTEFINNPSLTNVIVNSNHTLAFYDKFPKAKLHILIIPKGHYIDVIDFLTNASLEEKLDFDNTIKKIIEQFYLNHKGFNIQINTHKSHGQMIFHYHMHILCNE
jgi:diadenosine tetraphosphate (Ap4A) HIT family hydrolase